MNGKENIAKASNKIETATAKIEYLDRGFRQDIDQAMRNDIIRGLIEAITNADDAYGDNQGPILIKVHGSASSYVTVTVSDRACGIPPQKCMQS